MIQGVGGQGGHAYDPAAVKRAASGIESLFVSMLLSELTQGESLFGDGAGSGVYEGMFETQLADAIANRGGIGIARMIERSLPQQSPLPSRTSTPSGEAPKPRG